MALDVKTRRAINEEQVARFFAWWDPTWRWILILGLREMRANLERLGGLATAELGNDTWNDETYIYGPLALGVTASAINEGAQHCEDLFALLTFLRDRETFARRMGSYSAGKVIKLSDKLRKDSGEHLAARFCVLPIALIEEGLHKAANPEKSVAVARDGIAHWASSSDRSWASTRPTSSSTFSTNTD